MNGYRRYAAALAAGLALLSLPLGARAQEKHPNVVVIMTDDTGWGDLGVYGGGKTRNAPTPNLDRLAAEGTTFTEWYGQASCTAGRASFMTGRLPVRSALSVVIAPGDPNKLRPETPTIAEFFKKNGYQHLLLRQVAPRRHCRRDADQSWFRHHEELPRLLLGGLRLYRRQPAPRFSRATIRSSWRPIGRR